MRIGVVSDTHNHLRNVTRIVAHFNAAAVDRVVHTGDITQAKTLKVLAALDAPLCGVYGNNDLERPSLEAAASELGLELVDPPLEIEWHGRRIVVVHDPLDLPDPADASHALALHGHTHRHVCEWRAETLVFNPGECAGHVPGRNSIGIVDLDTLETERLWF